MTRFAIATYAYTYYLDGNQATKTDHTGKATSYTYDGLGRLIREHQSQNGTTVYDHSYTFDSRGNRASLTATGQESYTTAYQYDLNNRLLTESKEQGGDTLIKDYQYDSNGNTVSMLPSLLADASGGTSSLALSAGLDEAALNRYDGLNRLVQVERGDMTASYTYLPTGLRHSKTVNGVTTTHVWDGSNLVLDLTGGMVMGSYVRDIGLVAGTWGGNTSYYTFNAHGDVTGLTDTAGTLTRSYDYDVFGNEQTTPDANDTNPFRYCGEHLDAETGTYYLRSRNYNPSLGRFLSEDPILDGLNWYTYCGGNPVMFFDPTGLYLVYDRNVKDFVDIADPIAASNASTNPHEKLRILFESNGWSVPEGKTLEEIYYVHMSPLWDGIGASEWNTYERMDLDYWYGETERAVELIRQSVSRNDVWSF